MNKILFSKKSDNWATPEKLYKHYINNSYFDPCPLYSDFNALEIEWKEKILLIHHIVKLKNL